MESPPHPPSWLGDSGDEGVRMHARTYARGTHSGILGAIREHPVSPSTPSVPFKPICV